MVEDYSSIILPSYNIHVGTFIRGRCTEDSDRLILPYESDSRYKTGSVVSLRSRLESFMMGIQLH